MLFNQSIYRLSTIVLCTLLASSSFAKPHAACAEVAARWNGTFTVTDKASGKYCSYDVRIKGSINKRNAVRLETKLFHGQGSPNLQCLRDLDTFFVGTCKHGHMNLIANGYEFYADVFTDRTMVLNPDSGNPQNLLTVYK